MNQPILRCIVVSMALLSAGCGSLKQSGGPQPLSLDDDQRKQLLAATADLGATGAALSGDTEDTRRKARDAYIANRLVLLDTDFLVYLRSLTSHKRTLDSASEGSVLGLSVLGTIRDSVRAKENLAAAVAAITGLKSNIDKNFFENRGLEAIASMMVAKRKEVLARILKGVSGGTDSYSLVAARNDLNDYYLAGTMDGAFLTIQSEAAKRDEAATKDLDDARQIVRVTETLGTDTRTAKRALTTSLGSPRATPANVKKALALLGFAETQPPRPDDKAIALLREIVFNTQTAAKVGDLTATFREAGLIN